MKPNSRPLPATQIPLDSARTILANLQVISKGGEEGTAMFVRCTDQFVESMRAARGRDGWEK